MKYVDEFRDPAACQALIESIRRKATRTWRIMEVCGGQTHGLLRWGIDRELNGHVELLHGPGCPVCVTSIEAIDRAIALSRQKDVLLTSFGDMLRVPGGHESLLQARADGASVRLVYSPLDAVSLAQNNPTQRVVFFAVGFETTAPATAIAVLQAAKLGLTNFFLLSAHVRVQPAMESIASDPQRRVDGFLAAGHVCTVVGFSSFHEFVEKYHMPVVVTGFEPVDLLSGIYECVGQLERGEFAVGNCYTRSVHPDGNTAAIQQIEDVFEACDQPWRGFGTVPGGGLRLRSAWGRFDAMHLLSPEKDGLEKIDHSNDPTDATTNCLGGDVLSGRIKPHECPSFGTICVPEHPLGAPMVSSEGACAAYYRYARPKPVQLQY